MALKVGSARIDENGKAYGGKAGDQTGKEVSTQSYYVHSKGWRVFRAKNAGVGAKIAKAMKAACINDKIGYDQWERYDLFGEAKKIGFDLAAIKTPTECDCSELVRVCCAAAGILNLPTSGFRTGNMPTHLLKTGAFTELKGDKYTTKPDYLGAGDILVTKTSGHTVVVLGNGPKYEAKAVEEKNNLGDRTLKDGSEGEDVKQLQAYLIQLGYDCGKWGADGDFGDATELAVCKFQDDYNLDVDGQYGPKTHKALLKVLEALKNDDEAHGDTVEIVGGDCWVRSEANTNGAKLGVAKRGSKLPYAGQVSATGWLKVTYNGGTGWVSGKYGHLVE